MILKYFILVLVLLKSIEAGCFLNYNAVDCRLQYRNFYDFGLEAGDTNLTKQDDHFVFVQNPGVFKFYGEYFTAFFLSSNGVIELINKNVSFKLHEKFSYNCVPFPLADHAIIAPFWSDHALDPFGGEIFYRITSDSETLAQISYDINLRKSSQFEREFLPTWASIITWYQSKAFNHRRFDFNNTFQVNICLSYILVMCQILHVNY